MQSLRVTAGELTSPEISSKLEAEHRVIIEVGVLGMSVDMVIRKTAGTYYCDTPVKLPRYDTEDEMKRCLERYRLADPES